MAPTRVTVVEETLADPKDFEEYKMTYENIVLVGAGTYGSVYYVRLGFSCDRWWCVRNYWISNNFSLRPLKLSLKPETIPLPYLFEM